MDQPLSCTAVDPVFNNQARVVHKVRFVVGDQRHLQRDRVRCDQLVHGIAAAIFIGSEDGAISPGGLGLEGRNG